MKTIPVALAPQYAGAGSTLCVCLKVARRDATVLGFTSLNAPLTVSGVLYKPGFEPGDIVAESGLTVDNLELTALPDTAGGLLVGRNDLIAGLWDYASFVLFECNWKSPTDGINILKRGTMGQVQVVRGSYTIELRGLKQALQQPIGPVTTKTCRYRLGSTAKPFGLCLIDLTTWTHTYAVTTVTSVHVLAFTAATEASDYYGDGEITSLDGANLGYSRKIKSFAAGVVTLALEFPYVVAPGDTFTLIAGCRKRFTEDCKTKFANGVNFGGEKDVPGADLITADPPAG